MAHVPTEAGEGGFVPPSLANTKNPPSFTLRDGTRRDKDRFRTLLIEEGLRNYGVKDYRDEILNGLRANWSEADFDQSVPRLRQFWDAMDAWEKATEGDDKPEPFAYDKAERAAIDQLCADIASVWRPLRAMAAANLDYERNSPDILLTLLLCDWKGVDVPFAREKGIVPLDTLDAIATALERAEKDVDGLRLGTAMWELRAEAAKRMYLSEDEEKNSSSPAPSSQTPPPSTESGEVPKDGTSTEQAISTPTPATA